MKSCRAISFIFLGAIVVLTGCPRLAYVEAYNNTSAKLEIYSSGIEETVESGRSVKFALGESIKVKSDLGSWSYVRDIPHSGKDGPYFDGTLRVQINPDGSLYVLRVGETAPVSTSSEQPEGYPLRIEQPPGAQ